MKKLLFALILMPLMLLADTWRDPSAGITWTYTINDGEAQVGGGLWDTPAIPTSTIGAITIPSMLGGCPVTSIGSSAFFGCNGLTLVIIPEGVTSIGDNAFACCYELTSATISSGEQGSDPSGGVIVVE